MPDPLFLDAKRFVVPPGSIRWVPTPGSWLDRMPEGAGADTVTDLGLSLDDCQPYLCDGGTTEEPPTRRHHRARFWPRAW